MEQKQLLLTRDKQKDRQNRLDLFGADYVETQERIEQGRAEDAANANALANLTEGQSQIVTRLDRMEERQMRIHKSVDDVKDGVGDLKDGQLRVRDQIHNFKRRALAGINALADNGGSWLENCFPPRSAFAAVNCLKDLILLFLQLYVYFAFIWFQLCRSSIGITGTIVGAIPGVGGLCRPVAQAAMLAFLLWISTFILTYFAFGTMSGQDQVIYMIYGIRQTIKYIFGIVRNQIGNMTNDMRRIADEAGLTEDYQVLRDATRDAGTNFMAYMKNELGQATADAITNLPGTITQGAYDIASTATGTARELLDPAARGLGDAAVQSAQWVSNAFGGMFGTLSHAELGGGKRTKKSRKRNRGKKAGKTRRRRGGTKEGDFIRINELTNEALKETGLFVKYLLAVYNEYVFLYTHPKVNSKSRAELDDLCKKNPLKFEFNNPIVNMLSKTADSVLTSVKNDAIKGKFKVNYLPFAHLYNKVNSIQKGGKSKRKKRRGKKTKRKINKKKRKTRRR